MPKDIDEHPAPAFASNVSVSRPILLADDSAIGMGGFAFTHSHGMVIQYVEFDAAPPKRVTVPVYDVARGDYRDG